MTCAMKVTIDVVRYLPVTCRLNVITHLRLLKFKWMQLTLSRKFVVPIALLTNRIVLNKWNSRNLNLVVQGVHHGPTSGPICLIFLISSVFMFHVKQIQQIRKLLANFENETMNCSSASSSQRNGFNAMNASIASGFLCAAPVQLISPLVFPE